MNGESQLFLAHLDKKSCSNGKLSYYFNIREEMGEFGKKF